MFQLNASVNIRAKMNILYSHTLLRIGIIRGQRSVRISLLMNVVHSSAGVIWMCRPPSTVVVCPVPLPCPAPMSPASLPLGSLSLTLVNIEWRIHLDLKIQTSCKHTRYPCSPGPPHGSWGPISVRVGVGQKHCILQ